MTRPLAFLRSLWIWTVPVFLLLVWLPLLLCIRVFDRDPALYRTGRWFRRLGAAMVRTNPAWTLKIEGRVVDDPRRPYVVVSNHQSFADIPLISTLPWEMKWLAKAELFRVPVVGWMMKLAGDIPVERSNKRKAAQSFLRAKWYLERKCSVMFFPEGTRSTNGRIGRFNDGAFQLAIRTGVPILPLAIDGSFSCLPKNSWIFGASSVIRLAILEPVESTGKTVEQLCAEVRAILVARIAEWRGVKEHEVDGA